MTSTKPPPTRDLRRSLAEISQLAAQLQQAPATEGTVRSLEQLASLRKQVRETLRQRGQLPLSLTASSAIQADAPAPQGVDPRGPLSLGAVGAYAAEALDTLRRSNARRRQNIMHTAVAWPAERLLGNDFAEAAEKITAAQRAAREPEPAESLTAALCQPLEARYDIPEIGSLDRPVRDGLLRFGVERGGIQYRRGLDVDFASDRIGI